MRHTRYAIIGRVEMSGEAGSRIGMSRTVSHWPEKSIAVECELVTFHSRSACFYKLHQEL